MENGEPPPKYSDIGNPPSYEAVVGPEVREPSAPLVGDATGYRYYISPSAPPSAPPSARPSHAPLPASRPIVSSSGPGREGRAPRRKRRKRVICIAVSVTLVLVVAVIVAILVSTLATHSSPSDNEQLYSTPKPAFPATPPGFDDGFASAAARDCLMSPDCWLRYNFRFSVTDSPMACRGDQYVHWLQDYGKFVGVILCSASRYKILLSDSITGEFLIIGDRRGMCEDHCEFVGAPAGGLFVTPQDDWHNPVVSGYYRSDWGETLSYGLLGEVSPRRPHVDWYRCGVDIPGSRHVVSIGSEVITTRTVRPEPSTSPPPTTTPAPTQPTIELPPGICEGSTSIPARGNLTAREHYAMYKDMYTNCKYVTNILVLMYLDSGEDFDLSFLSGIREVWKGVLIYGVTSSRIPLSNLQVIRGHDVIGYQNKSYSLIVANNYLANSTQGLRQLDLQSLVAIERGSVRFDNNTQLCHDEDINWDQLLKNNLGAVLEILPSESGRRQCASCHEDCVTAGDGRAYCWGDGSTMCQRVSSWNCSSNCSSGCYGSGAEECCHPECLVGCDGPIANQCWACRNLIHDNACVERCPHSTYNPQTPGITSTYAFSHVCLESCPGGMIGKDGTCTVDCGADMMYAGGLCVKCPAGMYICSHPAAFTCLALDDCLLQYSFNSDDAFNVCKDGQRYVTWLNNHKMFLGITVCDAHKYHLFLSPLMDGTFRNIADTSGAGEDHCELMGGLNGTVASDFWSSPTTQGYYRSNRGEAFKFGQIGAGSRLSGRYFGSWLSCSGVSIPGRLRVTSLPSPMATTTMRPIPPSDCVIAKGFPRRAVAHPPPPSTYRCDSSRVGTHEVHVLAVYEPVGGYRPFRQSPFVVGSIQVNIEQEAGLTYRPVKLALSSYEAAHWVLKPRGNVNVTDVKIMSYYHLYSTVSVEGGPLPTVSKQRGYYGYGKDSRLQVKVEATFGFMTSFSGVDRADSWNLTVGM